MKLLAEWFWTDRWTGSSGFALPMEARGVYREMLTQAWRRGARLPNDHDAIRRIIGATAREWTRAWPVVQRFWRVDGEALVNDTQLEIYVAAVTSAARASNRGKKGAQAKLEQRLRAAQAKRKHRSRSSLLSPISVSSSSESTEHSLNGAGAADAPRELRVEIDPDLDGGGVTNADIQAFIKRFCELYSKHRHGAKYAVKRERDVPIVRRLLLIHQPDRLEKLAIILFRTDDEWIAGTDRSIGILGLKVNWLDGLLAEYDAGRRAS